MEETILNFTDAVLIISGMESILIMGDNAYILDEEYREKIQLVDLE